MKKNLRIVSVAAAALLAIAPVAASAVSVNAADAPAATTTKSSANNTLNFGNELTPNNSKADATISGSVNGVVAPNANGQGYNQSTVSFTGQVNASYKGQNYKLDLPKATNNVTLGVMTNGNFNPLSPDNLKNLNPGEYAVRVDGDSTFNFGSDNANTVIKIAVPKNMAFSYTDDKGVTKNTTGNEVITVKTSQSGVVTLTGVTVEKVKLVDSTDIRAVAFYDKASGQVVTTGALTINAGSDSRMNVSQIVSAFGNKYQAAQLNNVTNNTNAQLTDNNADAVAAMLRAQNITVDPQGYFTAPKSFTLTFHATSTSNNATAELPVTVTVPNGKEVTPATVPSQSKTIMHNAYFYDKDAKRVGTDKVTRYNTVTVAMNTTKLANGISYYEVIENGKATGKFINADNIDGTKRTLKHNAYVYKSSKKRANKVVLKKGTEVTTYGGSYTFKNGKQYYKIGNNTDKTYVKASNF